MNAIPKVLGVCGLIGSGKSMVMNLLRLYGIPIYNCDKRAKMMYHRPDVQESIALLWGVSPISVTGGIEHAILQEILSRSVADRKSLEKIIHTALRDDFFSWKEQQSSPWVALESAILFTSSFSCFCDKTLCVIAPKETRRMRVIRRDKNMPPNRFLFFEKAQEQEAEQSNNANYIINNDSTNSLILSLEAVLKDLSINYTNV